MVNTTLHADSPAGAGGLPTFGALVGEAIEQRPVFVEYGPRDLAEFQYRVNRRYKPRTILPRWARGLLSQGPVPNRS